MEKSSKASPKIVCLEVTSKVVGEHGLKVRRAARQNKFVGDNAGVVDSYGDVTERVFQPHQIQLLQKTPRMLLRRVGHFLQYINMHLHSMLFEISKRTCWFDEGSTIVTSHADKSTIELGILVKFSELIE